MSAVDNYEAARQALGKPADAAAYAALYRLARVEVAALAASAEALAGDLETILVPLRDVLVEIALLRLPDEHPLIHACEDMTAALTSLDDGFERLLDGVVQRRAAKPAQAVSPWIAEAVARAALPIHVSHLDGVGVEGGISGWLIAYPGKMRFSTTAAGATVAYLKSVEELSAPL